MWPPDPANAPGRQNDAAPAPPPSSFPCCILYCEIKNFLRFDAMAPAREMMQLLVSQAPAPHHLDGDPDPALGSQNYAVPAPERQNDAALAKPPTTFPCSIYSTIKFEKFNILMRLLVALAPAPHHLDGDPDPDPAPERQNDAALAMNPTSFPCLLFSKNINILMRLRLQEEK
jgi:hypothetical protein